MSSETSIKGARLKADAAPDPGLQPWQFFVLAALGCATAVTFIARGQGPAAIILLSILMATAAFVGFAALRMLRPLVSPEDDRTVMIGHRTRVALEREKMLALRSIKELEFDRAMGRLSDEDWKEMSGRLRVRAARLMRQLDAGVGYRAQIERELEKRLDAKKDDARLKPSRYEDRADTDDRSATASADRSATSSADRSATSSADRSATSSADRSATSSVDRSAKALAERVESDDRRATASADRLARTCGECGTANDMDARYCKGCGQVLAGR